MDVRLIKGDTHEDLRGTLRFVNEFDMSPVKRFYTVSNSVEIPCRGWIMHKRETKWFFPLRGKTTILIRPDHADGVSALQHITLDASSPSVFEVPPGYWFLIEQDGTAEVQVFSNCHVGEFANDDFRRPL
jgi:dTDP-4-dehydrorhamnose 3,5-epimerase